jgi:histidinol-phosphate aminotransferase
MLPEYRPALQQVSDVTHGALDFAELARLGLQPEAVLDFSVNGNPYGPSPAVRAAVVGVAIERYPDREALALRCALADHLGSTPERIMAGNGSMELLWLAALAFIRPGDGVVILSPTFGEYGRVSRLMEAHIHSISARPETAFAVDAEAVLQTLRRVQPRLVFLCNPNNPTGTYLPVETIAAWASALPGALFVVDEAYLTFAHEARSVLTVQTDNMLVLRSMTKAYALAGLRLGYAVGHRHLLDVLGKVRPPWSVNAMAQAAGIAALGDTIHLEHCLAQLGQAKQQFVHDLHQVGLPPLASATHFFLLRVGDATAYRQVLLQRGILVRDCTSFGLPPYIRVATRRPEENARLLGALTDMPATTVCIHAEGEK